MNKQLNVVIADDSSEFGQKCANILKGYGMSVELCEKDGYAVVKVLEKQKADVIIADVFMPGLDILGVLNALKELDIKVGYEEAKACFKAGINEILNF